jgi:hypothetical protein
VATQGVEDRYHAGAAVACAPALPAPCRECAKAGTGQFPPLACTTHWSFERLFTGKLHSRSAASAGQHLLTFAVQTPGGGRVSLCSRWRCKRYFESPSFFSDTPRAAWQNANEAIQISDPNAILLIFAAVELVYLFTCGNRIMAEVAHFGLDKNRARHRHNLRIVCRHG